MPAKKSPSNEGAVRELRKVLFGQESFLLCILRLFVITVPLGSSLIPKFLLRPILSGHCSTTTSKHPAHLGGRIELAKVAP